MHIFFIRKLFSTSFYCESFLFILDWEYVLKFFFSFSTCFTLLRIITTIEGLKNQALLVSSDRMVLVACWGGGFIAEVMSSGAGLLVKYMFSLLLLFGVVVDANFKCDIIDIL